MGRLAILRDYVDATLDQMKDENKRKSAYIHLYGVSLSATLIAKHRHEDAELAAMAAMLHDLYAYKNSSYEDHAHRGGELAREILEELKLTSEQENEKIVSAIYHHDDKEVVDRPFDEVLKDADVMHHTMNDLDKPIKEKEKKRFEALLDEFQLR